MNRGRAIGAGLFAGTLAGLVMTVVMLLLAGCSAWLLRSRSSAIGFLCSSRQTSFFP